jgi:hypothetical protein
MTASRKRAGLLLLVPVSVWAPSDHLLGQERPSPLGAIVAFVREYVPKTVPREMRPYEVGTVFLKVNLVDSERDLLGPLEPPSVERLGVTLVDDDWMEMLVASEGGHRVRDDGMHIVVGSVSRENDGPEGRADGALTVEVAYFVTFHRSGRNPVVCLEEWRVGLRPVAEGDQGWEVAEAIQLGFC